MMLCDVHKKADVQATALTDNANELPLDLAIRGYVYANQPVIQQMFTDKSMCPVFVAV